MEEKKSGYFSMTDAVDEFQNQSFGAGEKAVAGVKILGKGLFNVVRFAAAEVLPGAVEATAKAVLKNENATDEQRQKAQDSLDRAAQHRARYKDKPEEE